VPLIRSPREADEARADVAPIDDASLRRELASDELEARRAAVRRAAQAGAASLLAERVPAETDRGVRELLLNALVRMGDPTIIKSMLSLLRGEDAGARNAAVEALRGAGDAVVPELLISDPDSDVRILALNALAASGGPTAAKLAASVLARDAHVNVCAAAVDVIIETGGPREAPALRAALDRFPDQPFLAFAVRAALRRIG
jgi:HEAT repeat protein